MRSSPPLPPASLLLSALPPYLLAPSPPASLPTSVARTRNPSLPGSYVPGYDHLCKTGGAWTGDKAVDSDGSTCDEIIETFEAMGYSAAKADMCSDDKTFDLGGPPTKYSAFTKMVAGVCCRDAKAACKDKGTRLWVPTFCCARCWPS